jgi:general secretion pathway protein D
MKLLQYLPLKSGRVLAGLGLVLAAALLAGGLLSRGTAQGKASTPEKKEAPAESGKSPDAAPGTDAPAVAPASSAEKTAGGAPAGPTAPAADPASPGTNAPADAKPKAAEPASAGTNAPAPAKAEADKGASSDEVQLSLMGANVDMVVQWLAQNTGKTVIKSPKVQCQPTIISSKKLSKRAAITLVYRALALEGFSVTESSNAIYITPEGQEPKMNPELVDTASKDIPEGRQRLVKIFRLRHIQPTELKEKVRAVLSDKGVIECDDSGKQIIVTDYNENLRFLGELIKEFDVASSDSVIHIYPLKYADAEEVGNLIGLILNGSAPSGRAPSPGPGGGPSASPGGPSGGSGGENPGGMMAGMPGGMPGGRPSPGGSSSSAPAGPGIGSQITAPQVRIWPDKVANRLIVSAAKSRLPEVERLVEILDTDKPEDVCVRIIPLKNVTAVDLVKEIGPLYQRLAGKTRKDIVEVGANERSNSLIVLSSEANFKLIEKLVTSLDTEDAQEKVVRTFALKNADAEDVAKQLQDLNQDQNTSRYPYYFFGSSSMSDRSRKKLSVVADRRRNSLVVQAPPNQMDGIAKMIAELDEPISDDSLAPRIYHLKYASATDIEDVLNELFLKKTQRSVPYWWDDYQEPQADRNVGRLYGKVRITSEPYSNSLIITSNSKESLVAVEDVIKQLDAPSEQGESTLRVGLKFAKAPVVCNSINILFAKNGSPPLRQVNQQGQPNQPNNNQQGQQQASQQGLSYLAGFDLQAEAKEEGYFPWIGGQPDNLRGSDNRNTIRPVSDLVGRVRAVPDPRSNALLISANVHFFPAILKLVEELDAATDQVLIEARLVEVSADYLDRLGVRFSPSGSQQFSGDDFDNSITPSIGGEYMKGFGGVTSINSPLNSGTSIAQYLSSLRSGVLDGTVNMDFLIQFLRRTTDAKVLASPQINIRDNETGRLFVGQQVPIQGQSLASSVGSLSTTFLYKPVGIVLEVTPHITSSGEVELQIHAESSTIVAGLTVQGWSIFDTRAFRTDLTAKNGQTLVLGGIIQKQITDTIRKTPILGDIPGLGWLFKKKDREVNDDELMVFMRPRVTRTPADSKELLDETYHKFPKVKDWDQENQSQPPKTGKGKN